nr:probable 2,3-bisphosphoglycerate-independent phosphoglycerate mutase [Tanacetum cinerariifolium]
MQPRKRVAFVLIDGLGDVSIPRFGYKTPLEAAKVPNLDAIASAGVNGLMDPVEVGLGCGSDTAHLSIMGYDPRSNFATLDETTGVVTSRRADRHFEEEGPILCAALDKMKLPSFPEYEVRVRYATEHRCGVVVKGPKLSGNISGTDPLKDNRLLLQAQPLDDTEEAKHTVPAFEENHGLRPCMVAPTKIIAGLGLSLGIDILEAPGATGDYRTLLTSKANAIAKALSAPMKPCPNAIDDAGHDKATVFKVKGLEAVDKAIGQLARLLWEAESTGQFQFSLCITGDHSTPVEYGDHSFEPVPFTLCRLKDYVGAVGGESVVLQTSLDTFPLPVIKAGEDLSANVVAEDDEKSKKIQAFSGDSVWELNELVAGKGCLGRFPGNEMMGIIKKFIELEL